MAAAGCGASRSPSALDPARVVPANAIAYVEAAVRPPGAQRDGAETALTKLLGHSPDADLQRAVDHALRTSGLRYKRDIQPWLGRRVAFVLTAVSRGGVALIAPTSNPNAAVSAFERGVRRRGSLISQSYAGINYKAEGPLALGAVGHYAVIGGASAFRQIVDTYRGHAPSLKPPRSGALAQAYVNGPRAVAAIMALPTIPPQVRRQLQTVLGRAHLPTALSLSVSVSAHAFTADFHSIGASSSRTSGGADVSTLPGDAWLAISTGSSFARQFTAGFNAGFIQGFSQAARASGVNPGSLLQRLRRRTGIDLVHDLLPALGPFQLAVQGGSLTMLAAELALHPADPAAGARLVGDLHSLVARSHSLRVTGGPQSFSFGPASLPVPLVAVADLGRQIVARFTLSAATRPSPGKLSANPTFARAHSQLVAGSTVPLFLNFGPLASLLSETPQFKPGGRDHKALTVLKRLDYFVVGANSAQNDLRVVLGLH
jgi:hypothetical protein